MVGGADGFDHALVGQDVVVSHHGRRASTLRGQAARRFLAQVEDDPQEVMARVTGNYKRGNERTAAAHPRNQGRWAHEDHGPVRRRCETLHVGRQGAMARWVGAHHRAARSNR